jgi:hypothetical protein
MTSWCDIVMELGFVALEWTTLIIFISFLRSTISFMMLPLNFEKEIM